jgi:putative ABC transport system substrate-binding protein
MNMRNIIFILIFFISPAIADAVSIVSIQSMFIKPYNDALQGFKNACSCKVEQLVITELEGIDVREKIYEFKPDAVLAIGLDALKKVKGLKGIPVVYIMVLNPQHITFKDNLAGVSLHINPKEQLTIIKNTLPGIKKIGLLYNPDNTGSFVERAQFVARSKGIELFLKKVYRPNDVPTLLKDMKGKVNAFWMLPDLSVVTSETVELLFLFSIENGIPIITFSKKYLEMGALISLDIDAYDIGKQGWEITKQILSGAGIKKFYRTYARKANLNINKTVAEKLGIVIQK